MKTPPKTLGQFLATLQLTEQELRQLTGLTIPRLRAIYRHGNATKEEFKQLLDGLTLLQAVKLAFASVVGDFNQVGNGNKQHVEQNVQQIFYQITINMMRELGLVPRTTRHTALPVAPRRVAAGAMQQRAHCQLPGSQVTPVSGSLFPVNRGF